MNKSVAQIKRELSSQEITEWSAYYQVMDWVRKSEKDDPKKALAFAGEVHNILVEKGK